MTESTALFQVKAQWFLKNGMEDNEIKITS